MALFKFAFSVAVKALGGQSVDSLIKAQAKKEIKRVFQIANRRIQNIEKSGVVSTAYEKLKTEGYIRDTSRFSKFAIGKNAFSDKNMTLNTIAYYSKALEFINNQTSTATGARKYIKAEASRRGVSEDEVIQSLKLISSADNYTSQMLLEAWYNKESNIAEMIEQDSQNKHGYVENLEEAKKKLLSRENEDYDIFSM